MNAQEQYEDRTPDLIERIRKMRDAAQREMDKFGDPADYDTRVIIGQKKSTGESPAHTAEGSES
jgi:hypothetical protein